MHLFRSCRTVSLWCAYAIACLMVVPAPAQQTAPASASVALSPLQAAREVLGRAHRAKNFGEINNDLTDESAAMMGLALVLVDSMLNGMDIRQSPKAPRREASGKAFQGKIVALLGRYSLDQKTLKDSGGAGVMPPGLSARGHQFLADVITLNDAYEKSHPSVKGGSPSGSQEEETPFPAPGLCDFHVLSPTRVQIVPRHNPKSSLEARFEDGQWRLDTRTGAGASSPAPKLKPLTPQANVFLDDILNKNLAAVTQKLKADPSLVNIPPGLYHGTFDAVGTPSNAPLATAALAGDLRIAALLVQYGADVNAEGEFGETALDQAARSGNKGVVELLLAHGAKVGHKNDSGKTALHLAVTSNDPGTVAVLINHGADVNDRDGDEETPLAVAVSLSRSFTSAGNRADNAAIVKLLRQHGAK